MKKSQKSMLILGGLVLAGVIYLATKKPSTGGIPNDPIPQVPGSSVDEFERRGAAVAGRYNPHRQRKSWTV